MDEPTDKDVAIMKDVYLQYIADLILGKICPQCEADKKLLETIGKLTEEQRKCLES